MITVLFSILMLVVFGKLILVSIRATWGITKVIVCLILAPLVLVALLLSGFIYLAFILLLIGGGIGFFASR